MIYYLVVALNVTVIIATLIELYREFTRQPAVNKTSPEPDPQLDLPFN